MIRTRIAVRKIVSKSILAVFGFVVAGRASKVFLDSDRKMFDVRC